ncbi:MAG: multicopper oxidase domain-containing protein [Acidobacteria bacterium]|nr:multicopper oxidase domain-containing protein [Acidobacteriota bacterium]
MKQTESSKSTARKLMERRSLSFVWSRSRWVLILVACLSVREAIAQDIARGPDELPSYGVYNTTITMTAQDFTADQYAIAPGEPFRYYTFNGKTPGPFIRGRVGDTLTITLVNTQARTHSIDLHALKWPGGGSVVLRAAGGQTVRMSIPLLRPGLFVYHCAADGLPESMIHHINNGMYGLILVEPSSGPFRELLDTRRPKEFYVMQGDVYGTGTRESLYPAIDQEAPSHVIFNGRRGSLLPAGLGALFGRTVPQGDPGYLPGAPLLVNAGDDVVIYFGNAGVNKNSNFHIVGEIFDNVFVEGDLVSPPAKYVQTTNVPVAGAVAVHFQNVQPGAYLLVDHALGRALKGALGVLVAR